jgi:hypothetical protein
MLSGFADACDHLVLWRFLINTLSGVCTRNRVLDEATWWSAIFFLVGICDLGLFAKYL